MDDRLRIAQAAAALIVEEQIDDWQFARRKAARQLGCDARTRMPDRVELETALRDYVQLFLADEQPELVIELRTEALRWMEELAAFDPELTGPVAEGWAFPGCEIRLELLADDAKVVEIALLNRDIEFASSPPRSAGAGAEVLLIETETGPLRLVIQDVGQRRNRKRDRARMRVAELREALR
jgi:hypothetical protein